MLLKRYEVFKKRTISVNIKQSFFDISKLQHRRAISSVVERFLHTEEVAGSIPASPTNKKTVAKNRFTLLRLIREEHLPILKALNYKYVQGYFFSHPVNSREAEKMLRAASAESQVKSS